MKNPRPSLEAAGDVLVYGGSLENPGAANDDEQNEEDIHMIGSGQKEDAFDIE